MALYTSDSKDRVRDAVDFVELVGARTELRRAGPARYEGLCPFHEERTPSFGIDPTQKVYYCFGCQSSGDVFTFVQETEGVDFKGALELLAERYGVELQREEEDPREAEKRKRRVAAAGAADADRVLLRALPVGVRRGSQGARLFGGAGAGRGIMREFRVGYAPSTWDRVLLASRRGGFSEQELYATGLAQRSKENGRPYDRFRSRIMFPLADVRGRVLGFGARAMSEEQRPKYLNTSDNDIYHKGLQLYGADLARAHATRAGEVILCEGYTDVIALHQAGIRNVVGLMGTALTAEQVGELARMAQTVLLALDADSAGQEAMLKAFPLASKRKLELRVVMAPAGTDPADLIQREGAEAMHAAVKGSISFVSFRAERVLASGDPSDSEAQDRMIEELRPVFAELPDERATDGVDTDRRQPDGVAGGEAERLWRPRRAALNMVSGPGRVDRPEATATARRRARAPAAGERADPPRGNRAGVPCAVYRLSRRGCAGARRPGHRRAFLERPSAPRRQTSG